LLAELIDRASYDGAFRRYLRAQPQRATARMGLSLLDAEWAGLATLLYPDGLERTDR